MSGIRVYLAVLAADLDDLAANGRLSWTGRFAYAVTPALVAATPRADQEEREYLAFVEAAGVARALAGGARRVVVAADVSESVIDAVGDGPLMRLTADVPLREIASFHVDETARGDLGDLLWYDVTEAAVVRALLEDADQ
ncbi:MAG: hypothetical protein U0Q21_03825 [Dermatophilaceae bacterium]